MTEENKQISLRCLSRMQPCSLCPSHQESCLFLKILESTSNNATLCIRIVRASPSTVWATLKMHWKRSTAERWVATGWRLTMSLHACCRRRWQYGGWAVGLKWTGTLALHVRVAFSDHSWTSYIQNTAERSQQAHKSIYLHDKTHTHTIIYVWTNCNTFHVYKRSISS